MNLHTSFGRQGTTWWYTFQRKISLFFGIKRQPFTSKLDHSGRYVNLFGRSIQVRCKICNYMCLLMFCGNKMINVFFKEMGYIFRITNSYFSEEPLYQLEYIVVYSSFCLILTVSSFPKLLRSASFFPPPSAWFCDMFEIQFDSLVTICTTSFPPYSGSIFTFIYS